MTDILAASSSVLAQNEHWDGPGPWWPLFPLLWIGVVVAIVFAVSRFGWRRRTAHSGQAKLAERYAAGEIDEQEYRQRRDVLRSR